MSINQGTKRILKKKKKIMATLSEEELIRIADPLRRNLASAPHQTPSGDEVSVKSYLESLLPAVTPDVGFNDLENRSKNLYLCCLALASAEGEESPHLYWIPKEVSRVARSALKEISRSLSFGSDREFMCALMPFLLPSVKSVIKNSGFEAEAEVTVVASSRTPVIHAIVAAHQFRWLVAQVSFPYLGELCQLVIPSALTTLDHWSPEVKGPGMTTFIHIANNVSSTELSWYEDPILDACCRNIASSDMLWNCVVEMSVLLLTRVLKGNPRSPWYDEILSEMLGCLERHTMDKERRISWLRHIQPVFQVMGLFLLAHFKRIFNLLFQWIHANDDETLILVLERIHTVASVTSLRKSPFVIRLVDELVPVFKHASMRKEREAIRSQIIQIFDLLRTCHASAFEGAWERHKDNVDLAELSLAIA